MRKTLWGKLLVLLLAVAAVALCAALVLRGLMARDFRDYLEGEREDRVYWITADAERTYEKYGGWNADAVHEDAIWALLLGFEVRFVDADGHVVSDTASALAALPPQMRARGLPPTPPPSAHAGYVPYPLFLGGSRIGMLEVRWLEPRDEATFIRRSNRFLVLSVVAVGAIALLLSVLASRRLTRPLQELAAAAAGISRGDLKARAAIHERDEIGSVAEAFNRMAHSLERLEELRKRLLTDLAHELRTPLSAMRGEIEGMLDGLIPTGREELRSLHDDAGRLRRMLEGMEDLAGAQASAATLAREQVPLQPLLQHIVERASRGTGEKRVAFELACPEELFVEADPDKLSQVVFNVVDNAVKAVRSGGRVRVAASPEDGGGVVLSVEDDGVGISAADLPFVFERFYRRSEGGLGIGLAIAKELVEAHGGRIEASSEPGKGSLFTVRFPTPAAHNSS